MAITGSENKNTGKEGEMEREGMKKGGREEGRRENGQLNDSSSKIRNRIAI